MCLHNGSLSQAQMQRVQSDLKCRAREDGSTRYVPCCTHKQQTRWCTQQLIHILKRCDMFEISCSMAL